jgi:hypothetical protein
MYAGMTILYPPPDDDSDFAYDEYDPLVDEEDDGYNYLDSDEDVDDQDDNWEWFSEDDDEQF